MTTTYYAGVIPAIRGRKWIELNCPSGAVPMIAEYLDWRYEICGLEENAESGEYDKIPLKIRHKDYDNQKGYILFCDPWDCWEVVGIVCEEETINEKWIPWWGEEIFELHLLPLFENSCLSWFWRDGRPGLSARVWSEETLLKVYEKLRFNGRAWQRRYDKLLSKLVLRRLKEGR